MPEAKPDRSEIPAAPDLAALLKDYKGDAAVAAGEAFDPSPAAIEARLTRAALARRPEGDAAAQEDPRRRRRRSP